MIWDPLYLYLTNLIIQTSDYLSYLNTSPIIWVDGWDMEMIFYKFFSEPCHMSNCQMFQTNVDSIEIVPHCARTVAFRAARSIPWSSQLSFDQLHACAEDQFPTYDEPNQPRSTAPAIAKLPQHLRQRKNSSNEQVVGLSKTLGRSKFKLMEIWYIRIGKQLSGNNSRNSFLPKMSHKTIRIVGAVPLVVKKPDLQYGNWPTFCWDR